MIALINFSPAAAQDAGKVQIIEGHLAQGENHLYLLLHLKQGDNLSIYVESLSGNLDPAIGLSDNIVDPDEMVDSFYEDLYTEIEKGRDPLLVLEELRDEYLLAYDDDRRTGYDASLAFRIPEDGDNILTVGTNITVDSFGDYRLTIGINAPVDPQSGEAIPTGDTIAVLDKSSKAGFGIQQVYGTLTQHRNINLIQLRN